MDQAPSPTPPARHGSPAPLAAPFDAETTILARVSAWGVWVANRVGYPQLWGWTDQRGGRKYDLICVLCDEWADRPWARGWYTFKGRRRGIDQRSVCETCFARLPEYPDYDPPRPTPGQVAALVHKRRRDNSDIRMVAATVLRDEPLYHDELVAELGARMRRGRLNEFDDPRRGLRRALLGGGDNGFRYDQADGLWYYEGGDDARG